MIDIDHVFPFNFVLSDDLTITNVGPSLKSLVNEGASFQSQFEYVRPKFSLKYDFQSIKNFSNQVFIINLKTQKEPIKFKGQFLIQSKNEKNILLFLGSPWLLNAEDINRNQFKVSDFALHDTTLDVIQILSDYELINADLKNTLALLQKNINELSKKNLRLNSLIYSLTHDFRAPILNCLGLLDVSGIDFEEIRTDLKFSLSKLDEKILNIAQIFRLDNIEVKKEFINIDELINQSFVMHSNKTNHLINFIYNNCGPTTILTEKIKIESIINNLISNAVKFSDPNKENATIKVSISTNEAKTVFEFEDNGVGIDQTKIENIFKPFYRANNLRDGTGLGLYIVEQAVESLNGKISVSSVNGVSTTFLVEI